MFGIASTTSQRLAARVVTNALAALVLTSVHHAYGAYIFHTPWRLNVLFVSGFAAGAIIGPFRLLRRRSEGVIAQAAFWALSSITLLFPITIIGFFEGGYNYALKDALYFAGASPALMTTLFPPPTYELPNDVFFEVTGVLQLVVAITTGYQLYSLVRERLRSGTVRHRASATA
jgi:hypothetical protein